MSTLFKNRLVEALVIIGSILLAFAIDSLWENYQEDIDEERYLQSLLLELEQRTISDESSLASNLQHIEGIQSLSRAIKDQLEVIEITGVDPRLPYSPARAALDDLVGSGGYQLIDDPNLRLEITHHQKLLTDLREYQQTHQDFINSHYLPPIMTHILPGSVTAGGIIDRSGVEFDGLSMPPNLEILYNDREFYNTLYFELGLTLQRVRVLEELSESTKVLIELIRKRLALGIGT